MEHGRVRETRAAEDFTSLEELWDELMVEKLPDLKAIIGIIVEALFELNCDDAASSRAHIQFRRARAMANIAERAAAEMEEWISRIEDATKAGIKKLNNMCWYLATKKGAGPRTVCIFEKKNFEDYYEVFVEDALLWHNIFGSSVIMDDFIPCCLIKKEEMEPRMKTLAELGYRVMVHGFDHAERKTLPVSPQDPQGKDGDSAPYVQENSHCKDDIDAHYGKEVQP